jgi:Pin2-interacting protein X1
MAYVNDLSGSKLRSRLGASLNEAAAAAPNSSGFAKKQLEKMGWKDGKGLGKNQQGMATHIKVTKREDDAGIGHVRAELQMYQQQQHQQWWSESMGNVFAKLNASAGTKKKKSKNVPVPPVVKHYTDEELFDATGGARFGMRAQRKQIGKWARAETISSEEEEQAKNKIEWNGHGQAKIILSEKEQPKDQDKLETVEAPNTTMKKEKTKKKRKRDDETNENDDSKSGKRKKDKKGKKEKQEKKKMRKMKIVD